MRHHHLKVFVNYLENLRTILSKISDHCVADSAMLNARLAEDMLPLSTQVEITINFALRSCYPIAGQPVASLDFAEKSFSHYQAQLNQAIEYLQDLDNLNNDLSTVVNDKAGPVDVALPAYKFLDTFAWPNFYFHLSMVYAIGRAKGVALSKGDFDGIHSYPTGFSFEGNSE